MKSIINLNVEIFHDENLPWKDSQLIAKVVAKALAKDMGHAGATWVLVGSRRADVEAEGSEDLVLSVFVQSAALQRNGWTPEAQLIRTPEARKGSKP